MSEKHWRIVFTEKGPVHHVRWWPTTFPQVLCTARRSPLLAYQAERRRHCKNCERIVRARERGKR